MGLDNGFLLRDKKFPDFIAIEIAYFRKYYELDEWVRHHCTETGPGDELYILNEQELKELLRCLEPIANTLRAWSSEKILYCDDNDYPPSLKEEFYSMDFDPTSSQSEFAGNKLMRLYRSVLSMLDILDANPGRELYFEFYSSY